jgi:uncharacterized membrane protein
MGGVAGTLAFWLTAMRLERVANSGQGKLKWPTVRLSVFSIVIYAVTLWRANALDPTGVTGLLAAAGGLFIVRLVVIVLGITGWDQPKGSE